MNEKSCQKVSVVIPAFNEEKSVAEVIGSVIGHPLVGEVIVVDDGSTDETANMARQAGALVHEMLANRGKAEAMHWGVKLAAFDCICFLDADISGLDKDKLDAVILPVLKGKMDMQIAIRDKRQKWLNAILHFFPLIGGERVVSRDLWFAIPEKYRKGYRIEIALNYYAKQNGRRMGFGHIEGLDHIRKEKKHGFYFGVRQRVSMALDLMKIAAQLYIIENVKASFSFGAGQRVGAKNSVRLLLPGNFFKDF